MPGWPSGRHYLRVDRIWQAEAGRSKTYGIEKIKTEAEIREPMMRINVKAEDFRGAEGYGVHENNPISRALRRIGAHNPHVTLGEIITGPHWTETITPLPSDAARRLKAFEEQGLKEPFSFKVRDGGIAFRK